MPADVAAPAHAPRSTSSTLTFDASIRRRTRSERLVRAWGRVQLATCVVSGLGAAFLWPVLLVGSLLPVVSIVALPALLAASFLLFHLLPATLRLALAEPQLRLFPPFDFFHPLRNFRLWISSAWTLLDIQHSHLLTRFLENLTQKVLLLRKTGSTEAAETCRANIVYVPAGLDTGRPARRLDVYLTEENDTTGEDKENVPLAQVVILLAFPSYRLAGSRSFPASAIAAQLRSTLDVCVVVPSLTPFSAEQPEGEALERMVGETRECVKWVGDNIARYGGDSEQIWLIGFGAGAHIASLAMVQSAVIAAREDDFARRIAHEAARAKKEGLVSVDIGSSSSVRDPLSPKLPDPASSSSGPALGNKGSIIAGSARLAGTPSPPSRPRQRTTSSDPARSSPSTSFERSSSTREGVDPAHDDGDEIERLLELNRLARLEKLEAEAAPPTWSESRADAQAAIASGVAVPFTSNLRATHAIACREHDSDEDDRAGSDFELSISDGVRSCRLFTLGSITPVRQAAQQLPRSRSPRAPEEGDEELFVPDPSLYRQEPEFGLSSSGQPCTSLAAFDLPSSTSERRKKRGEPIKRVEVKGMILVEGTYDIVKQAKWEADRSLEQISSLQRLCEASHRDFLHACPAHLLYAASPLLSAPDFAAQADESRHETTASVSRRSLPPKVLLIHGGADHLSPFSPAVLFRNLLIGVGLESDEVKVKLYRHLTGFGALAALMGHGPYATLLYDEMAEMLELNEDAASDEGIKGKGKAAQQW